MSNVADVLLQLQHEQHLTRSKGRARLQEFISDSQLGEALWEDLRRGIQGMMTSVSDHARLGGFLAAALVLPRTHDHPDFIDSIQHACLVNLEHKESRVRIAVGDCFEALARLKGAILYSEVAPVIEESIRQNFERGNDGSVDVQSDDPLESLLETSYKVVAPGSGEMRHGTEGWKSLETSYRSLLKIVEGTGAAFTLTSNLKSLVFRGLEHPNRFVREIAFFTVSALTNVESEDPEGEELTAKVLAKGLGDDWSQVRYAASVAVRSFMQRIQNSEISRVLLPCILPQMCLNRYYVADGVRLYSQETWKMIVGDQGRQLVAEFAPAFVDYYVRQCAANNHAVREAACSCIAELMTKIKKEAVAPYVEKLIQALVNGFKDASWPVRDAACCACGKCVLSFPEASRVALDELYTLWLSHLADNIASVRENSAVALGQAIRSYGQEAIDRILPEIRNLILEAKNQEPESIAFSGLNNVTRFGVAEEKDDLKHTDQAMFSCGSLAPKLARGGGCMDHGFKRAKQPWEVSDGAIYLVRELSIISPEASVEFLPALIELARLDGFTHAHNLHQTVWKVTPVIARSIGKRSFKRYLEGMLMPLFRSTQSGYQLEEAAAVEALIQSSQFLGEGIFCGRLNEEQRRLFEIVKTQRNVQ